MRALTTETDDMSILNRIIRGATRGAAAEAGRPGGTRRPAAGRRPTGGASGLAGLARRVLRSR